MTAQKRENFFRFLFQMNKFMAITFFLYTAVAVEKGTNYINHEFGENPGIFFERMDDIQFEKSKWSIVVYWNASKNAFPHDLTNNSVKALEMACKAKEWPKQCAAIRGFTTKVEKKIDLVKNEYEDLMKKLADIKNVRKDLKMDLSRPRRSFLLRAGTKMAGWATGMALEYIENKIVERIGDMVKKKDWMTTIHEEKMQIIEARPPKNDVHLDKILELVKDKARDIKEFGKGLAEMNGGSEVLRYLSLYVLAAHELEDQLTRYHEMYEQINTVVHEAKLGQVHPDLLTRKDMKMLIEQASHPDYEFPLLIESVTAEKISRISDVKIAFHEDQLMIEILIPLVEKTPTEIFKIHPVFVLQKKADHIVAKIATKKQYIARSHDRQRFAFLTEENLRSCRQSADTKTRICTHETPFLKSKTRKTCESELLWDPNLKNLRNCPLTVRKTRENTFTKLKTLDGWLYSAIDLSRVEISCPNNEFETFNIRGMGVLQIKPGCTADLDGVTIWGSPVTEGRELEFWEPKISLDLKNLDEEFFRKTESVQKNNSNGEVAMLQDMTIKELNDHFNQHQREKQAKEQDRQTLIFEAATWSSGTIVVILFIILVIILIPKKFRNTPEQEEEVRVEEKSRSWIRFARSHVEKNKEKSQAPLITKPTSLYPQLKG